MSDSNLGPKNIQAYLQTLMAWMRLNDWTIMWDSEYPSSSPDVLAEISIEEPYQQASVRTHIHFFTFSAERQRAVLVHELLHCYTERLTNISYSLARGEREMRNVLRDANEYSVDGLSQILSPHLPLPVLKKARKKRKR